jgi:peptidyl-prolyl cis-trans isomerase SurA
MSLTRIVAGLAAAAVAAQTAVAQTAPAPNTASAQRSALVEGVVATVNDEIISSYDLRQRTLLLLATSGVQPTQDVVRSLQQQALRSLIDEKLQRTELERYNVVVDPEDVEREIAALAQENGISAEQLFQGLAQTGVAPDTLRQQIRAQVGWRRLMGGLGQFRVRIGDDQIAAAMRQAADAAAKPSYLVGEIFLDAGRTGGVEEAQRGAEQLIAQLQQGAPFQAVARQFSAAPSAAKGGDAGWLVSGEIRPAVLEAALQNMQPGQLSRPIPTEDGVWIVYLRDKRDGGGGTTVLNLAQAAVRLPADATEADVRAAEARLTALRGRVGDCAALQAEAAKEEGVIASYLGETATTDLAPAFRQAVEGLEIGQVSAPVRTNAGLHLIAVCDKKLTGPSAPDREQIADRLYGQQVALLARRTMRDLRNNATIETR